VCGLKEKRKVVVFNKETWWTEHYDWRLRDINAELCSESKRPVNNEVCLQRKEQTLGLLSTGGAATDDP